MFSNGLHHLHIGPQSLAYKYLLEPLNINIAQSLTIYQILLCWTHQSR